MLQVPNPTDDPQQPYPNPPKTGEPRFLEQVANASPIQHQAYRTEQSYVSWVKRFILFHNTRHPRDMGPMEVRAFLTHLTVNRRVSASTQNQSLNALVSMCAMEGDTPQDAWPHPGAIYAV